MSGYPIRRDIVLRGESASLIHQKDFHRRLELLFNVHVSTSVINNRQTVQYKDRCDGGELVVESGKSDGWVTVRGNSEEDCIKTQRYVLASSKPECRVLVPCGPQLVNLLFEGSPAVRDTIEKEYDVLIVDALKDGGLYIQGSQPSVTAAVSRVCRLSDTIPPLHHNANTRTQPTINQPISNNLHVTPDLHNFIIRDPTCMTNTLTADKIRYSDTTSHSIAYRIDTKLHQRINQYVQLGFPVDQVKGVIESLGPNASENDIMSRLVINSYPKPNLPLITGPSKEGLRPIVIDGSNVAMKHSNGKFFSCRGIEIALQYFCSRGHSDITIFVPQWRKEPSRPETPIKDQEILFKLEEAGFIKFTPSRRFGTRKIVCYDDRFIVQLANDKGGVIVSDDNFRDLFNENASWREIIEKRVLQFVFVEDNFMVPQDPLGKHGPRLDAFLRFERGVSPNRESNSDQNTIPRDKTPCPYKEKCTFGPRCRYYHPEREIKQREKESTQHEENNSTQRPDSWSRDKEEDQLAMRMNQLNFQSSPQKSIHSQPLSYIESSHDRQGGFRNTHPLVVPPSSMIPSKDRGESIHSSYSHLPHDQWMRDDHRSTTPRGLQQLDMGGYPKYPDPPSYNSSSIQHPHSYSNPHSHPHSNQRPHTHPHLISPHVHPDYHHAQYSLTHALHGNDRQGYSAKIPSSRSHSANIVGGYSAGYPSYKDPRELEQIQSLSNNQKMIYEKTVEMFPQHKDRILAIIIQYRISDINLLIQLLGK